MCVCAWVHVCVCVCLCVCKLVNPSSLYVGVNSVQLMGRVGADPQTVSGETNGTAWSFVQFPLATNETRYIQSEDSELVYVRIRIT